MKILGVKIWFWNCWLRSTFVSANKPTFPVIIRKPLFINRHDTMKKKKLKNEQVNCSVKMFKLMNIGQIIIVFLHLFQMSSDYCIKISHSFVPNTWMFLSRWITTAAFSFSLSCDDLWATSRVPSVLKLISSPLPTSAVDVSVDL